MTLPAVLARSPKGDAAIQGPPAPTLKRGEARHTADLGRAPWIATSLRSSRGRRLGCCGRVQRPGRLFARGRGRARPGRAASRRPGTGVLPLGGAAEALAWTGREGADFRARNQFFQTFAAVFPGRCNAQAMARLGNDGRSSTPRRGDDASRRPREEPEGRRGDPGAACADVEARRGPAYGRPWPRPLDRHVASLLARTAAWVLRASATPGAVVREGPGQGAPREGGVPPPGDGRPPVGRRRRGAC
ncbi:hypothetical protein DFR50_10213, partial [Roseiarcus fermentans]